MSGGSGGGFFDDALESLSLDSVSKGVNLKSVFNDGINLYTQAVTAGTVGFKDGKFSKGATTQLAEEAGKSTVSGLKEVTGAKAAEKANKLATDQFEQQKAQAAKDRADAIKQSGIQQMQLSTMAGVARRAGQQSSNNQGIALGSDEKDFLGL